jgi:raffinose/stachyose/melibiose transport system substrate-binding protein
MVGGYKMKRRVLAILLAMVTTMAVTACSVKNSSGNSSESNTPVTVHVVSGWNNTALPNWADAITTFETQNPLIKIQMDYTPAGLDGMAKLRSEFMAGTAPDVVQAWKTFFNEFVADNLVVNLTADYEKNGWNKPGVLTPGARNWCAKLTDANKTDPDVYGVADYDNTSVFFYNTDVFKALNLTEPTNLSELITVGKALKAAGKKPMVVVGNGGNLVDLLAKLEVQFTTLQYILDVNTGKAKLTDQPMLQAMQVVEQLIQAGVVDPSSLTYVEDDCAAALANGSAGMYSMHTGVDSNLRLLQQSNPKFHYAIMKSVKFTDNPVSEFTCTYGGCWMIPKTSKVQDAAKKFLLYIFGPDVSKTSASVGGRITNMPASNSNILSQAIKDTVVPYQMPTLKNNPFYLIDMMPGTVLTALETGMQGMIQGKTTPEAALQQAQTAMDTVIANQ